MPKITTFLSPPFVDKALCKRYTDRAIDENYLAPSGTNVSEVLQFFEGFYGNKVCLTSSGSSALHLAMKVLGVGPEDTVWCSDITFIASCSRALDIGNPIEFLEVEPDTMNVCPKALEEKLSTCEILPKVVIVPDTYGVPAKWARISELCRHYGVLTIQDSAPAFGSYSNRVPCGILGDVGCVSFNGNKIITGSSGGLLVSKNEEYVAKAKYYSSQCKEGSEDPFDHKDVGLNASMSNVIAGVVLSQIPLLIEKVSRRAKVIRAYKWFLKPHGFEFQALQKGDFHNSYLACCIVPKGYDVPKAIYALREAGVESRRVWKPLSSLQITEGIALESSSAIYERGLVLPTGDELSEDEIADISSILIDLQ